MTTPGDIALKALTAAGTAAAAAAAAHSVRTENVSQKTASVPHAQALGGVAEQTGKFEQGLESLKRTNAEPSAFDAYAKAAGLPPDTITTTVKNDPVSSAAREVLGTEGVEVRTQPDVLAKLQQQRQSELATISAAPKVSTAAFEDVSAPEAQIPSDSAEQGQLLPPTGSTGTGGPSNFASLSHARYGRRSGFTQLISPTPEEPPTVSSSPPTSAIVLQLGFIILSGIFGGLLTWYGLRSFFKPSK